MKRDFQTSVTFGNVNAIDLLAHNQAINYIFKVQVKALRKTNYFLIGSPAIKADHIYVFVLLNKPGEAMRYFIVPGSVLMNEAEQFGKDFQHPTMPGIHPKRLQAFEDAWSHFDTPITVCANTLRTTKGFSTTQFEYRASTAIIRLPDLGFIILKTAR